MRDSALAALVALPLLLGAAAAPSDQEQVAFSFHDSEITESSALVSLGTGLFATTNDSGDEGRVFTVDSEGRTVGVTHWSEDGDDPDDVEALAPAGGGTVWVADIGDNRTSRDAVYVAQVPVGRGDRSVEPEVYELVYPDGSHDAETIFTDPDGRLYLATKSFLGGSFYAAPATLSPDGPNRLQQVGPKGGVLPMATDGVLWPDGKHVLIRGYVSAALYDLPTLQRLGSMPLPQQPQGEGLAVTEDGTLYLSSEGRGADVLRLSLSADLQALLTGKSAPPSPAESTAAEPAPDRRDEDSPTEHRGWWPWLLGGVGIVAVVFLQYRLLRRPR